MREFNSIGDSQKGNGLEYIQSFSPLLNTHLEGNFKVATLEEIEDAISKATQAFLVFRETSLHERAAFLREIARGLLAKGDALLHRAHQESALSLSRLEAERGRTIHQLHLFADWIEEGSYLQATIEHAQDERIPKRKPDLRKMLKPLGPVVVFTASNFPFAYSTAGGDTASALAAGNPVIVKAHESHLGTNEMVSDIIIQAARKTRMPDGIFSNLVGKGNELGRILAKHPGVKAIGFTGSRAGGKAIFEYGMQRDAPIPVFAEMGSINPVLLFPNALQSRREEIIRDYVASITLDMGQFCTNPGLLIGLRGSSLQEFITGLAQQIEKTQQANMLSSSIWERYVETRQNALKQKGVELVVQSNSGEKYKAIPTLALASGEAFLENPNLHEEVFGPFSMIIACENAVEFDEVVQKLQGQLTLTLIGDNQDFESYPGVMQRIDQIAGRIIFNGVPTGVEVCKGMHHGGPFPATTDVRFTAVGEDSIYRWLKPVAYQDCPDELLPDALKEGNPLNIMRRVNGRLILRSPLE
jgi:alpha-ketoglutaric semialdehyde dehydrogenase